MNEAAGRCGPGCGKAIGQIFAWLFIHDPAIGIPLTVAVLVGAVVLWWRSI